MKRRRLAVPRSEEKFEISFNLGDLTSTMLIRERFRDFLTHLGLPERFSRLFLEAFSQWSTGREYSPRERKVLLHAFLKDGLAGQLIKQGATQEEIDQSLLALDNIAEGAETTGQ